MPAQIDPSISDRPDAADAGRRGVTEPLPARAPFSRASRARRSSQTWIPQWPPRANWVPFCVDPWLYTLMAERASATRAPKRTASHADTPPRAFERRRCRPGGRDLAGEPPPVSRDPSHLFHARAHGAQRSLPRRHRARGAAPFGSVPADYQVGQLRSATAARASAECRVESGAGWLRNGLAAQHVGTSDHIATVVCGPTEALPKKVRDRMSRKHGLRSLRRSACVGGQADRDPSIPIRSRQEDFSGRRREPQSRARALRFRARALGRGSNTLRRICRRCGDTCLSSRPSEGSKPPHASRSWSSVSRTRSLRPQPPAGFSGSCARARR